jgi:hypothetical protein
MLRKDKEASTKTKWRTDITKKQTENRKITTLFRSTHLLLKILGLIKDLGYTW